MSFIQKFALLLVISAFPIQGNAQLLTYTFTNCGATGRFGPTQTQVTAAYASTNLSLVATTNATSGIQTWTVPTSGNYRIEVWGAKGGDGAGQAGGNGARMQGEFNLTSGAVLKILVGQMGIPRSNSGANSAGTGGGGSFVTYTNNVPLIVAGGGGGAGSSQAGLTGTTIVNGTSSGGSSGAGGLNGGGGGGALSGTAGTSLTPGGTGSSCSYGSGGGGFYTRGGYNCSGSAPLIAGDSYTAGGFGGAADPNTGGVEGGFGGGAGVGHRAGGGGGWSGGGGDGGTNAGGGGGSYNAGSNQVNVSGFNAGHGRVFITRLCNITLTAAGTNSNGAICAGQTVTITTDAISNYTWSTGSNASSITDSPTVTTTYSLTAMSPSMCMTSAAITVTVDASVPSLTVANTATAASGICPGQTVALTASGATTYSWTGGVSNGVAFTPTTANTYTITGFNACGTTTAVTSVSVHPFPNVIATITQPSVCSGNTVATVASGAVSYTWSHGQPNGSPFFPSATTVYTVTGTSALTCTNTATVGIIVAITPVLAPIATPTVICIGNSGTLSAQGASNYTWLPVNTFTGSNSGTIVITPTSTATYTLIKANSNCVDTKTITVAVNQLPGVFAIASTSVVCAGSTTSLSAGGANNYTWTPSPFNLTGALVVVSPTANTTYTCTGNDGTCSATYTLPIVVNPIPTLQAQASSTAICSGQSMTLSALGGINYTWNPGGLNGSSIVVTPTNALAYTLIGDNSFSCTTSIQVPVIVFPNPTVNATPNRSLVCIGGPSTITATGANTYVWSTGSTTNTTVVNPAATSVYTVTGTFTNSGCSTTRTVMVQAYTPVTGINGPTAVCIGSSITISSAPANSYTWSVNGNFLSNQPSIVIGPTLNTTYILGTTSTSNNVSCVGGNSVTIQVNALPIITASSTRSFICRNESTDINAFGGQSYNWLFVGTGQSQTVSPQSQTIYTVQGTDANGCVNTATVMIRVSACIGLEEQTAQSANISVFPNPSKGDVEISGDKETKLVLYNELGQLIMQIELNLNNNYTKKIEGLVKGIYFVKVPGSAKDKKVLVN